MMSGFLLDVPGMPMLELTQSEYNKAVSSEPFLAEKSTFSDFYLDRSATLLITPGKDSYLDNEAVIHQFKRFMILMKHSAFFKKANFRVDILVDQATTHTKALVDLKMFSKSPNRKCPIDLLKWEKNGVEKELDCFFRRGDMNGQSKGLFHLCQELNLLDPSLNICEIKLEALQEKASDHPAFRHISKLEDEVKRLNKEHK